MKDLINHRNVSARFGGMVGQSPGQKLADQIFTIGFTQIPVIEYVTWTVNVPVADGDVQRTFGNQVDVFQDDNVVPGVDVVDSSFVKNGELQVDMLVSGIGAHIFGEPLTFTQIGNSLSPAPQVAYDPPVSPDVFTNNDATNGTLCLPANSNLTPAFLAWGWADWEAAWHFANAYELEWIFRQRFYLLKEMVSDVAYFGPYAEATAAGDSDVPLQKYARFANDRYRDATVGGTGVFQPINARRTGSLGINGAQTFNRGTYRPTRDFDLVGVTWGGIRNQGGAACCVPFRKMTQPIFLQQGLPIGLRYKVKNDFHHNRFQQFLSLSGTGTGGGTLETVAFDQLANNLTAAGVNCMVEQTLDCDACPVQNQQTQTNRVIYKGGTLKISLLIKGFEVWGKDWANFLQGYSGVMTPEKMQGMNGGMGLAAR